MLHGCTTLLVTHTDPAGHAGGLACCRLRRGILPHVERQLPGKWHSISSSAPFSGLSSFCHDSSCPQPLSAPPLPFRPHAASTARPGTHSPHKPGAGAANGIPRAVTDKRVLSAAPATQTEAATTALRETEARSRASVPPAPRALGEAGRSGTGFRGRAGAGGGCAGRAGPGEAQRERWRVAEVPGICAWGCARLLPLFPSVTSRLWPRGCPHLAHPQRNSSLPQRAARSFPSHHLRAATRRARRREALTSPLASALPPPPGPATSAPPCCSRASRVRRKPTASRQGHTPGEGRAAEPGCGRSVSLPGGSNGRGGIAPQHRVAVTGGWQSGAR